MPHIHAYRIVLADAEHARLIDAGASPHFHTVEKFTGDHIVPHRAPHTIASHDFARRLATRIERLVETETFDKLFLVAPAGTLADLRAHLGPAATAKVKACVQKDLTKVADEELPAHFPDWPLVFEK